MTSDSWSTRTGGTVLTNMSVSFDSSTSIPASTSLAENQQQQLLHQAPIASSLLARADDDDSDDD